MSDRPGREGVQLGCGTLIIIALIVMFFSGGRDAKELRIQLDEANRKIDRLETKIDAISARLGQQPLPDLRPLKNP
jgi:hypothetical protein